MGQGASPPPGQRPQPLRGHPPALPWPFQGCGSAPQPAHRYLYFFKDSAKKEDASFIGLGSSLRAGDFIFGQERGRMSLANAECVSESVREDGRLYTQITLTGALSGLSQDSFMQKG